MSKTYRTKDIARRCGLRESDVAALLRMVRQAGRYDRRDLTGGDGQPYRISQTVYDEVFGDLESAYREVQQAEMDAKHEQLAASIAKRAQQIRARVVRAATGRTELPERLGMRSRRPYKFRHRDGASIRLYGPYRERSAA